MKQLMMFVSALFMSTLCFANSSGNQSDFSSKLGATWKSYHNNTQPQNMRNDLTIVYGGEDMSNRPTLAPHGKTV